MGHSEPASGLCSVAKMLIAMETGVIPPNLHFENPNPDIPALSDGRLQVSCVKCMTGWKFVESCSHTHQGSGNRI
jgi:fatty acid synthase